MMTEHPTRLETGPASDPAAESGDNLTAERTQQRSTATGRRGSLVRVVSESTAVVDAIAVICTALAAELLYSGLFIQAPIDYERTFGLAFIAALATIGIFAYLRLYRSENVLRPSYVSMQKAIAGWFIVVIGLIITAFLTKTSAEFSRGWAVLWALLAPAVIMSGRFALRVLASRIIGQRGLARHVAIFGSGPIADRLALHLRNHSPELVLVGIFDDRKSDRDEAARTHTAIGTADDLVARGQMDPLDEIIVTVPMNAHHRLNKIVDTLAVLPVDINVCPGLPVIEGAAPRVTYLDDMPLISALERPIGEWSRTAKTAFDRIVSGLLLMAAGPFLLLVAAAIRLESKGPALFRQRRHGFNHEIITVLKFRTMTVMEDGDTVRQATRDDERITGLGQILRRTSLDELPQLINVVKGEMSLVGPRPHALAHNYHYAKIIGHYAARHRVKPGITGLAQVDGLRGETDTTDKMAARIQSDLYYIENWSLWMDIKILLRTFRVLLGQPGAY